MIQNDIDLKYIFWVHARVFNDVCALAAPV